MCVDIDGKQLEVKGSGAWYACVLLHSPGRFVCSGAEAEEVEAEGGREGSRVNSVNLLIFNFLILVLR